MGEQVIANASLIKTLQRSVDDLRREVRDLKNELKHRKFKDDKWQKETKKFDKSEDKTRNGSRMTKAPVERRGGEKISRDAREDQNRDRENRPVKREYQKEFSMERQEQQHGNK